MVEAERRRVCRLQEEAAGWEAMEQAARCAHREHWCLTVQLGANAWMSDQWHIGGSYIGGCSITAALTRVLGCESALFWFDAQRGTAESATYTSHRRWCLCFTQGIGHWHLPALPFQCSLHYYKPANSYDVKYLTMFIIVIYSIFFFCCKIIPD